MNRFKVGQVVEIYTFSASLQRTWGRGIVLSVDGTDDDLFRHRLPAGYIVAVKNYAPYDRPCSLWAQDEDLRSVCPLDLLAEVTSEPQ
jgi:hypothetical protein